MDWPTVLIAIVAIVMAPAIIEAVILLLMFLVGIIMELFDL